MTVVKSIITLINIMILISLGDTASRTEDRTKRIGLWIFAFLYTITTGLMWW